MEAKGDFAMTQIEKAKERSVPFTLEKKQRDRARFRLQVTNEVRKLFRRMQEEEGLTQKDIALSPNLAISQVGTRLIAKFGESPLQI